MIFGTAAPKFRNQSGEFVLLDKAKILVDSPVYDYVEKQSVLNGYINHLHFGYHWEYAVRIHVYKESESISKANILMSYLGSDVYLYRHREANPFKDKNGVEVLFRVQEVTPDYLNTPDFKDIIDIKFKSVNYVDLRQSFLNPDVMVDSDNQAFGDSDGNLIKG